MKTILFTLILICSIVLIPTKVNSQMMPGPNGQQCMPYDRAITPLLKQYSEVPHWRGVEPNGRAMIEIWLNSETGTFTIMRVLHMPGFGQVICASIGGNAFHKVGEEEQKKLLEMIPEKTGEKL